jgi:hypothetical protein
LSLLKALLTKEPSQRLGAAGAGPIKKHPFFKGLDWAKLEARQLTSKFKPGVKCNLVRCVLSVLLGRGGGQANSYIVQKQGCVFARELQLGCSNQGLCHVCAQSGELYTIWTEQHPKPQPHTPNLQSIHSLTCNQRAARCRHPVSVCPQSVENFEKIWTEQHPTNPTHQLATHV